MQTQPYTLPPPFQEHEETDELLLWDDEMAGLDPDQLPRRRLLDFSIYNSEVRRGCVWALQGGGG